MKDQGKSKDQLIAELIELRRQLADINDIGDVKRTENSNQSFQSQSFPGQSFQDQFMALADILPGAVFEADINGKLKFASSRAFSLFGYQPSDLEKGVSVLSMICPTDRARAAENFQKFLKGIKLGFTEYLGIRTDGKTFPMEIHSSVIYQDQKPIGLRGIILDVSDRKRVEKALQKNQEQFKAIFEATPDPMVVYDPKGYPRYLNPAFTTVFGWTLDELKGRRIPFVPDDQKEKMISTLNQLKKSENPGTIETQRLTKSGQRLDVSISAANIGAADQQATEIVVNLRDISNRKKLETQLQVAGKFEALGTLAGGIAHDFNNLLMGIQGNTSLIMLGTDKSLPNYERLKQIEELIQSGAGLTRQLLGFCKGGKYEVKTSDLNVIIGKTIDMFSRTAKAIHTHVAGQADIWMVEIDPGQIEQVLLNLFVNAGQAMPDGGDLSLKTENMIVDGKSANAFHVAAGKYVKVSITDTGIGMDDAIIGQIFDPFFTTKNMGLGTGLGLATVYGIIQNHDGIINVYSEKGYGTTFTIYLPASDKAILKEENIQEELLKGNETILIVDDEEAIVDVGGRMLTKMGYGIRLSRSGKEALEIYNKDHDEIDAVILDLIMPDMSGKETFDALKAINPDVKVLLSSGYSINGQVSEILSHGCSGFIQKPFSMSGLSKKLREILDDPQP
jgi:PAS domain S-box-containing protein